MKHRNFLKLALSTALLVAGLSANAQVTKIRFAHAGPEATSQHQAALEFAKLVKERSGGKLEVQVFPGSQLGNDSTVIGAVRGGTIEMMMAGSGNFAGLVPRLDVLDIPFLFRDQPHAYKTVDGDIGQSLMKGLETGGLKQLAFWEVGFRSITTKNRAVRTPADVKGLKIRTTPNPTHVQAWKLLGTNPVPMPLGELYQALEAGAVDAQEHPIDITYASKFYEVQKHLTMTRHAFTAMPVVFNKQKFDALSPELQKVLLSAASDGKLLQRNLNQKNEAHIIAELKKNGMQVIETFDPAPFKTLVNDDLRKSFIAKNGPELLTAVDAIK
ncbi:TRAP transporter substrate-binding protein [Rhodoferax ferrireducens]|uniref:TRAP transporter substrate-binding protein n=1 Tax=Rhodoferax ferrireducens TaxID=192843 RepID=UPI000E0D7214|nr:TRAP transporter substrate-binding protein [Rhodoferax ferrireducens]